MKNEALAPSPALQRILAEPAAIVGMDNLHNFWRTTTVTLLCARPAGLEPGPWMARSVRGAWGRMVWDLPFRGGPAHARDAFFGHHHRIRRNDVPVPVVVEVDAAHDVVTCRFLLFGMADRWRDEVIETAISALNRGVGIAENSPKLAPWSVLDWWWTSQTRWDPKPMHPTAILRFLSPFRPGSSEPIDARSRSVVKSLAARIEGMARWMLVDAQLPFAELLADAAAMQLERAEDWPRMDRILKQCRDDPWRPEQIAGITNALLVFPMSGLLWRLFDLGQSAHIGGRIAYGFGRYQLEPGL